MYRKADGCLLQRGEDSPQPARVPGRVVTSLHPERRPTLSVPPGGKRQRRRQSGGDLLRVEGTDSHPARTATASGTPAHGTPPIGHHAAAGAQLGRAEVVDSGAEPDPRRRQRTDSGDAERVADSARREQHDGRRRTTAATEAEPHESRVARQLAHGHWVIAAAGVGERRRSSSDGWRRCSAQTDRNRRFIHTRCSDNADRRRREPTRRRRLHLHAASGAQRSSGARERRIRRRRESPLPVRPQRGR